MSTHLKEKEEKLQEILENLTEENMKGKPIIVEGKKDIQTLRAIGIQGKIISAKTGGKTSLDIVSETEKTQAKEIILLLDFDRRGKELTKKLAQHLETARIKVNLKFWKELSSLTHKDIKDIESLAAYMETLKRKIRNS